MVDDAVKKFVEKNPDFEFIRENTKVRCKLTQQDFPCRLPLLEEYCQSKSYKKAKAAKEVKKIDLSFDFTKYEPHIIQHKKVKTALFCQLTGAELNKIPSEVEKHIKGKRYKQAKKEFEEMVANDASVSEEEEEEDEDELSELSGIDEIDFTPAPKKRKTEAEESTADGKKTAAADVSTKIKSDSGKLKTSGEDKTSKKTAGEKKESGSPKMTASKKSLEGKKERLLPLEGDDTSEEDDSDEEEAVTSKKAPKKLNKKAKKRLEASKTEEQKKDEQRDAAIKEANSTTASKKEKTCKQKRKINSKTRRKQKSKEGGGVTKEVKKSL